MVEDMRAGANNIFFRWIKVGTNTEDLAMMSEDEFRKCVDYKIYQGRGGSTYSKYLSPMKYRLKNKPGSKGGWLSTSSTSYLDTVNT